MIDIKIPENIIKGIVSGKKNKNQKNEKVKIDTILISDEKVLQFAIYTDKQVFHKNLKDNEVNDEIIRLLTEEFNNLELSTKDCIYSYRITSKGKVLSNKRKTENVSLVPLSHNKKKNYLNELW